MRARLPTPRPARTAHGAGGALAVLAVLAVLAASIVLAAPLAAQEPGAVALRGRVERPSGTPADERLVVEALSVSGPAVLAAAPVAPDGAFELALPPGPRAVRLALRGRWLRLPRPVLASPRDPAPVVLRPLLGGRLEGRVVGLPLGAAGARPPAPRLTVVAPAARDGRRATHTAALEGAAFALDALPPGEALVLLAGAGPVPTRASVTLAPGRTTRLELVPARGARVAGVVAGADGAPLAGARVVAEAVELGTAPSRAARADAAGRFALPALPSGAWRLRASAPDHQPAARELRLADGAVEAVRLELAPARTLRGRVTWPDGAPAAGARVTVRVADPGHAGAPRTGTSDADGRFAIGGLSDGRVTVHAAVPLGDPSAPHAGPDVPLPVAAAPPPWRPRRAAPADARAWRAEARAVPTTASEVALVLGAEVLVGRVVDDLGRPLQRFRVRALRSAPVVGPCPMEAPAEDVALDFENADGGFVLDGLRAGRWQLRATAADGSPCTARLDVPSLADAGRVVLVAPRPAAVAGLVLDAAGRPVADATVRAVVHPAVGPAEATRTRTDADGRYRLQGLYPGAVRLAATHPGHAPTAPLELVLDPGAERAAPPLRLRAPGSLVGRVHPAAGQLATRGVLVQPDDGPREWTTTDADGRFAFTDLAPGRHLVRLDHDLAGFPELDEAAQRRALDAHDPLPLVDDELAATGRTRVAAVVEVRPGLETRVVLGGPDGPVVHGRVVQRGPDGERPARGVLRFVAAAAGDVAPAREVELDAAGRYAVTLPAPGGWAVRLPDGTTRALVVPAVARHEVDLALP